VQRDDPIPELKRQAAAAIVALLDQWAWQNAAALIGTDQPRVSDLRRGKLDRFSLETLIRFLARLRKRVELRITADRIDPSARTTAVR
jgi:predicted XRE-type DNA-binding protein